MDFSFVIPPGVGIASGTLAIFTNTVAPVDASADWTQSEVTVHGRAIYAILGGGKPGVDYQLRWAATDTEGSIWPRTGLVLCALTS
jgi:hypothetical protein